MTKHGAIKGRRVEWFSRVEDIGAVVDWLTERCEFQADAKSNLAVLHNRNDMTNLFRASNWESSSHDSMFPGGSPLVLE